MTAKKPRVIKGCRVSVARVINCCVTRSIECLGFWLNKQQLCSVSRNTVLNLSNGFKKGHKPLHILKPSYIYPAGHLQVKPPG